MTIFNSWQCGGCKTWYSPEVRECKCQVMHLVNFNKLCNHKYILGSDGFKCEYCGHITQNIEGLLS